MHYEWLEQRFKEVAGHNSEADFLDGFRYAVACLHRDLEPGVNEGEFNLYEALTSDNQKALAKEIGIDRATIWRRLNDFRN